MRSAVPFALLLPLALLGSCEPHGKSDSGANAATAPSPNPIATSTPVRCRDDVGCGSSEYCEFNPGLCGKGQRPGSCRPKPVRCDPSYDPVCACDGKVYDNACAAHAAGEDLAVMGGCNAVLPDFAACGAHYCDAHLSYCEIYLSDVFELPTDHFCQPLPEACKPGPGRTPRCDCFPENTACLSFCGPLATGGIEAFHLTCQGKKPPHS